MAISYPDILDKVLDNANIGKAVTDVGSGFALSISIAMLLGLWTGMSILPADRSKNLAEERIAAEERLQKEKEDLRPLLIEATRLKGIKGIKGIKDVASPINNPNPNLNLNLNLKSDALYSLARREIADLSARLESLSAQIEMASKASKASKTSPRTEEPFASLDASLDALMREKTKFASLHERLLVQRNAVDEEAQKLQSLRYQEQNSRSFSANAEILINNLVAILPFSVIFGVVLSQISRLLFVTLLFDGIRKWILKRSPAKSSITAYIKAQKVTKEEYDALVTHYYRYVEGAINMIAPALLFGAAFPTYANSKLGIPHPLSPVTFGLLAAIVALLLLISGFFSYDRFRQKEQELCETAEAEAESLT